MLPVDYNDRQKKQTYIFFDFECTQDDRIQWSFEVSSTILTIYPIIFSLIVNLPAIMTHVVASVFFFGVITFVTVCTEVDATQERSHAGNTWTRRGS
jgi:hypothetical protein